MEVLTLQELIEYVADSVRDLTPGTTTNASAQPNVMQDTSKGGRRPNHWQNSEVVFTEPSATLAGRTGSNPFVVTGYNNGIFTLDHDFGPAGIPQGIDYMILRNHGQGNPYRAYLTAIKRALDNLGVASTTSEDFVSSAGLYTYTVPTLDTVYKVTTETADYGPYDLPNDMWDLYPGREIRFNRDTTVDFPWTVTLHGRRFSAMPASLDGTVTVDLDDVVDFASEYLNRTSARPIDQAKGQSLQAERIRFRRRYALPNERLVIP